jgi:hypothetical protein
MTASLSQAPRGLTEGDYPQDVGPEGIEIVLEGEEGIDAALPDEDEDFDANLAETMDEGDLQTLSSDLLESFEQDLNSRKEWVQMYVRGMEVLGMKYEERTEPWAGACGVYSTILTEAAIRFQADTITETFPAAGPVKTEIIGAVDKPKEEAAERVRDDMNYQLTEVMTEYRPEHERMLYNLGLGGAAFKKVYYDPNKKRQTSIFVPAEDVVMPYGSTSSHEAERVTHLMRKTKHETRSMQVKGFYRDVDLGEPEFFKSDIEEEKAKDEGYSTTDDDRYQFLEIHVMLELPGGDAFDPAEDDDDRLALPYVVTLERGSGEVVAVRRNWDPEDDTFQKRQHFVQYTYIPGFGAYGMGLIHVIGGYARAGTSIIRQLVDAGTLSNLPGGMKTRGMRTKGDDTPIAPGEFRDVDIPNGNLRDNILPLPYKEPSGVLLQLLERITDEGRRLGSIADMQVGDASANAPVGTTLAILERQLKTMSAVQARVHYSMKQEFKLLKGIIRDYTPQEYSFDPSEGDRKAKQADYDLVDVIPVSDPNSATMSQRIMQYQAVQQLSTSAPQIYNLPYLHRQMIEVLGIKNADKLVPLDEEQKPRDPISENMSLLTGKPTKAFIAQNHDAHIAVHNAMLQDPTVAAQMGQNPMAQQIQFAIQAHISEHMAFQYRQKVEEQLGASLPEPDAELDPQIEAQLSGLVAKAAQQLLQMNKQAQAQQQAQQQAQDPIIQMQQQELALKGKDLEIKDKKVTGDLTIARAKLQIAAESKGQPAPQETPEMVAQRHAQEMQAQQQQQMSAVQQAQQTSQQTAQRHEQELRQAQEAHALQLMQQAQQAQQSHSHGAAAHDAKMEQTREAHRVKQALAIKTAANTPKPATAKPKKDGK